MDGDYDITWEDIDEDDMVEMVTGRSVESKNVSEAKQIAWENTRANKMHEDALNLHPIGWYLCSSRNGKDDNLNNTVVRVMSDKKDTIWICQHASPKSYPQWSEMKSFTLTKVQGVPVHKNKKKLYTMIYVIEILG